ncbi:MAG: FecR domain-containing protein [Myxococcota bacterium]
MRKSDELARALQEESPALSDLSRARIERALLNRDTDENRRAASRFFGFRSGLAVGGALSAVLAALAIFAFSGSTEPGLHTPRAEVTRGALRRERPVEGRQRFVLAEDEELTVRFGVPGAESRLTASPSARLTFEERDMAREIHLEDGRIRVEFHPERRGEESLVVHTRNATVHVVGTVFSVTVVNDETRVTVEEGRVRVVSARGESTFVGAGESVSLEAPIVAVQLEESADPTTAENTNEEPVEAPVAGLEAAVALEVPPAALGLEAAAALDVPSEAEGLEPATGPEAAQTEGLETPLNEGSTEVAALERSSLPSGISADEGAEGLPAAPSHASAAPEEEPAEEAREPLGDAESNAAILRARALMSEGRLLSARHELYFVARDARLARLRAEAWTLVAETFERTDLPRAVEAYRRASLVGRSVHSLNALFAMGRLRTRLGELPAARRAYEAYLERGPTAALAGSARSALCHLGDPAYCEMPVVEGADDVEP